MRQLKLFVIMTLLALAAGGVTATAGGPARAWSDSDNAFLLKTTDGLEQYTVDGTITFKAVASGTIPTSRDAGVVFTPANEGDLIQITVNSCDLTGDQFYLLMYDGAIEKIGYGTSDGVDQSRYLPAGWIKKFQSGSAGETYTSTAESGQISFAFHSSYPAGTMTGWNITVTALPSKDMEYVSTAALSGLSGVNRGAKDQAIFGVNVKMDGGSNALSLDELVIDASALAGSTQVSNVRLYKGTAFTADNLLYTAATVGDNLTAANVTLRNGDNKFMVVADILSDAKGAIPSLTVSSVKVGGEARTATPATGDNVQVNNVILMPAQATTFTIDDNGAKFYDDGGATGKVGTNFTGQVTFVPATEGMAIKVDVTKLAIFNTSSTGKNDIFKFYNGREANEENLITTLLNEAELVKSTAPDGSMTVTLTSTTGVPADGWEAEVSQFLPGDMTFSSFNVAADTEATKTVAAGDKAQRMLVLDVVTDNQSNPLNVASFNLATTTPSAIDAYAVYYLGKKNEFSTSNLYAQGNVEAATFTATGSQELVEGHNYFAVVVDVNEKVNTDDNVNLSATGMTVGETLHEATGEATRKVSNICHITKGSHSHTMYGEWTSTTTESTLYLGKYEFENADYIVTFVPAEQGTVAEIDFSAFDVTYGSSSYGTRAVFEIYSGSAVNSDNLLWKLDNANYAKTGPGRVLRSTAPDGSMTIRFNPNTTSSYYAATGWTAKVRPFLNHDMSVVNVAVNQTSTDVVSIGTKGAELIDFNVMTEGTLSLATAKEIKLNVKGAEAVEKFTVLYAGDATTVQDAVTFGSAAPTQDGELVITGEQVLAEGNNRFFVQFDVKDDAESEVAVDADLVSITTADGVTTEVLAGNPTGERVVKSMLIMQSGVNVVTVNKPLMFYDDGGPDGNFSKGFNGTVTFVPGKEGYGVVMDAKEFAIGSTTYQKFNVYHGREVSDATKDPNTYSTTTGPANLISEAADGTMTVTFSTSSSSYSTALSGFAIEVKLHEYKALHVDEVKTEAASDNATIVRGALKEPIAKVELVVANDNESVSINDLKFNATGVDNLAGAKLYYTATGAAFDTQNLFAQATPASEMTFTATEPVVIDKRGSYYFWLAYDLNEDATPGEKVGATFVSLTGGDEETVVNASLIEREVKAGFHGTYTIGASAEADYATFAAATAELAQGVDGPVRFEVEDGTYSENIKVENIAGTSENHPIVFTAKSGNRDNVIVKGSGVLENQYESSTYYKKGMVYVLHTPFVTFENMSFVPQSQSYTSAVQVVDRCNYFTMRNCYVKADRVTSSSGMNLVRTEALNGALNGQTNDYMTFENNTLEGGYIGFYIYGPGTINPVEFKKDMGMTMTGNTVSEVRSKAFYISNARNVTITNNLVQNSTTTANGYNAFDLYIVKGASVVAGNTIVNAHSAYSNGIYMRGVTASGTGGDTADEPMLVYNNSIVISNSPTNSTAGIQVNSVNKNIHLYYNTVRVAGTNGYCFYNGGSETTWSNIKLQNNLFQDFTTSGYVALFNNEDRVKATAMENNVFYSATGIVKEYATTLDALNTMVGSTTNKEEKAVFVGDVNNHLLEAGNLKSATPVSFITTDLDGKERDAATPTVGAYEFEEVVNDKPEIAEDYPVVGEPGETQVAVKTKWNVGGKLYSKVEEVTQTAGNGAPAKAPTAADLKTTTPVDVVADAEVTTNFTDLTPNTQYKAYFLMVNDLGTEGDVVETEAFTTLRHIEALTATAKAAAESIEAGGSTTITVTPAGGDAPYTIEWRDQMNNVVGNEATVTVTPEYTYGYKATVTSADGQQVTAKVGVIVRGEAVEATFEDNYLPEESFFNGDNDDDTYYSGSYAFSVGNAIWPGTTTSFWYDFALSNQTSTEYKALSDQYHSATGGGHNSSNFVIAYPQGGTISVTHNADGDVIPGFYITNTAYAYTSMTAGDGYADPLPAGGWLKVRAYDADNVTNFVDFYLADLRADNELDHYVVSDWEWFDLTPLGKVKGVQFVFDGSDKGQWGLNTPAYFAMDNFGGERDMKQAKRTIKPGANKKVPLKGLFELLTDGSTVTYGLEVPTTAAAHYPASDNVAVTLDNDRLLVTSSEDLVQRTVVVSATQKGHTQFVELTIAIDSVTGVESVEQAKAISSVTYVNAAGQQSATPFSGLNIVVTRYTDGSTTTVKQVINR